MKYELYLGMGCFWGVEKLFNEIFPSIYSEVGYIESEQLKEKVEVVKLYFDEDKLFSILDTFFSHHYYLEDKDYPVPDRYQSVVFIEDKKIISTIKNYTDGLSGPIRTKIDSTFEYTKSKNRDQKKYLNDPYICTPFSI